MKRLIDLTFSAVFFLGAISCAVVYLVTKEERTDLVVIGVGCFILAKMMLNDYINRKQEA